MGGCGLPIASASLLLPFTIPGCMFLGRSRSWSNFISEKHGWCHECSTLWKPWLSSCTVGNSLSSAWPPVPHSPSMLGALLWDPVPLHPLLSPNPHSFRLMQTPHSEKLKSRDHPWSLFPRTEHMLCIQEMLNQGLQSETVFGGKCIIYYKHCQDCRLKVGLLSPQCPSSWPQLWTSRLRNQPFPWGINRTAENSPDDVNLLRWPLPLGLLCATFLLCWDWAVPQGITCFLLNRADIFQDLWGWPGRFSTSAAQLSSEKSALFYTSA